MNFGKAIRTLRKHSNQSQQEFADDIGISQTSLSLIESGKTKPTDATLNRIAEKFKTRTAIITMAAIEVEKDVPPGKRKLFKELFPDFEENVWTLIFHK
ncbi:helix-turn-helix domain-containing protein [Chitinophaga flava]|uniref:HTH cro/C1-type domain-containing protein n=1 Tax=Chitinophaga flava TaxID=2259036 RepID=A0A365XS20_9BACT|nr:helix-turn-helix transcriptional regulator [Chitinophaga flava]RBL88918.1 hypothetical protein DF182_20440 [Chitinophaga flava]